MNSDERREARRARRAEKRQRNRDSRIEGLDIEAVADLNALYRAAMQAGRGGLLEGVDPAIPEGRP